MKLLLMTLPFLAAAQMHAAMSYETYIESWDYGGTTGNNNVELVVVNTPGIGVGGQFEYMVFDVAFGNLNFTGTVPDGYQFTNASGDTTLNLDYLNGQIKAGGGKLKLSFGGATYPIHACSSFGGPAFLDTLPNQIATYIKSFESLSSGVALDGVDFDIEDAASALPAGYNQQSFAAILQQFLIAVRQAFNNQGLPNALISVTMPAQGWNLYWQYLIQGVTQYEAANNVNIVDYWNMMEYDMWVNTGQSLSFTDQIIADIKTYTGNIGTAPSPNNSPGWGIPSNKVQLGIMPGVDDSGHQLSPTQAQGLIQSCIVNNKLYDGMMTWDHDRDAGSTGASKPETGYGPYAFNNTLRPSLAATEKSTRPQVMRGLGVYLHRGIGYRFQNNLSVDFVRQPPPPHGAPLGR